MGKKAKQAPLLQASAIPYRVRRGRLQLCLITSRKGRWGFPKGIIDPGETPTDTALKEAEEEAGLSGEIDPEPLGSYEYRKWGRSLRVACYLMLVTEAAQEWEEQDFRQRTWVSPEEARAAVHRDDVGQMIDVALARLAPGDVMAASD